MEVNLKKDEELRITVDDSVTFKVWGFRNAEGTLCLEYEKI